MVRIDLVPKATVVLLRTVRTPTELTVKSINTLLVRHDQVVRAAAVLEADLPVDMVPGSVADVQPARCCSGSKGGRRA
jgi:hypothetical protein